MSSNDEINERTGETDTGNEQKRGVERKDEITGDDSSNNRINNDGTFGKYDKKEVSAQRLRHKQQLGVKHDPEELSKTTTAESKLSFSKVSVNVFLLRCKSLINKTNDVQDQKN